MRIVILLLAFPLVGTAQLNRSANELAKESSREYVVSKIFKGKKYEPIHFGELKAWSDKKSQVTWTIDHAFTISDHKPSGFHITADSSQAYHFLFYMDKRMKILKAESYSR